MKRRRKQKRIETTLERLGCFNRWFVVPRDLLQALPIDAALVLSYLLNFKQYQEDNNRTEDGWFRCSVCILQQHLNLSERRHRDLMRRLKALDLIEMEMRGNPAKRWLRVNESALRRLILENSG